MLVNKYCKLLSKGQSLWEVIIALAISSLIALGLVRVTTTSVKTSQYSSDQSQATALAQKKINDLIVTEETDSAFWTKFLNAPVTGTTLLPDDILTVPYCARTKLYNVTSTLSSVDPDAVMGRISVEIFWDENGDGTDCNDKTFNHSLKLETYVTNKD